MPYRITPFSNNNFYHVFNRGVEKRKVFLDERDYQRFLQTVYYYQFSGPKPKFSTYMDYRIQDFDQHEKIIDINCYCLMPNHFHFLLRQATEAGVQEFMSKLLNSYTKYFNTKRKRIGPLFQGQFKSEPVIDDYQLSHVSRYIHLNPYVSGLIKDAGLYSFSSYKDYLTSVKSKLVVTDPVLALFRSIEDYKFFISDHEGYALELERVKHLLIDGED